MINVDGLTYKYDGSDTYALSNVSFSLEKGQWLAIVGHNGSGKSTLAKLLDGLLLAEQGTITVDGIVLNAQTIWDIRRKIGIVFQNPDNQFVGATVQDDVAFGLENQGVPREEMLTRVKEALEAVDMWHLRDSQPSRLSGGQKQRVAIAGVLALQPSIIILDEATAMLDPKGRAHVIELVKTLKEQYHLSVLSITHDVKEALLADKVLVLKQGQVQMIAEPTTVFGQGDSLQQFGLAQPFAQQVKQALQQKGVNVPETYMTTERLVEWIWQSSLNK